MTLLNFVRSRLAEINSELFLLVRTGSYSYGIANANSDEDYIGVYIGPRDHYLGLTKIKDTITIKDKKLDITLYEIKKFFYLLIKGSPNIFPILYTPKKFIKYSSWQCRSLFDEKDLFSSKQIVYSFYHFARNEFKKLCSLDNNLKYNKSASHVIRLLRMVSEFIKIGSIQIDRTLIDAIELKNIREGNLDRDYLEKLCLDLIKNTEILIKENSLPDMPEVDIINNILIDILEEAVKE